jgi:hypothetical protein
MWQRVGPQAEYDASLSELRAAAITPFGPASLGLDHVNAAPREVDRKRQADGPAPTIKTRVSNKIRQSTDLRSCEIRHGKAAPAKEMMHAHRTTDARK